MHLTIVVGSVGDGADDDDDDDGDDDDDDDEESWGGLFSLLKRKFEKCMNSI